MWTRPRCSSSLVFLRLDGHRKQPFVVFNFVAQLTDQAIERICSLTSNRRVKSPGTSSAPAAAD